MAPNLFLACAILLVLGLIPSCSATTVYTVGDSSGWDISTEMPAWVVGKDFYVGDALLFKYSQYHSVSEVGKDGYDACDATKAIMTSTDGNTSVPLTAPGERYFICGTLSHCLGGMQLQVHVSAASAPSPAPGLHPHGLSTPGTTVPLSQAPSTVGDDPFMHFSNGFVHGARDSMLVAWLCSIGALLVVLAS